MFSEEAEAVEEHRASLETEREELALKNERTRERVKKYDRLKKRTQKKGLSDRELRRHLTKSDREAEHTARKAARMELLLPEEPGYMEAEGMEKTYKFKQEDIASAVPLASSLQHFSLKLDTFGPYSISYSRHGRNLLLGGRKGHIASFDWRDKKLSCEFHVREVVRDVTFLHNEMMYAAAQKRYLYIYDHTGMELHCLKDHTHINRLTFLPYHFLLVSVNEYGMLRYLDTSVGKSVAECNTHLGTLRALCHNPHNAIVHLGHHNGTVTLWSPNQKSPLVKMLCHRGPVTDLAVDSGGWYMATTGMDARMKIWDVRMYNMLHCYRTRRPAVCVEISQRGLIALGRGREVEVWRDAHQEKQQAPYLTHRVDGEVSSLKFCPFEDCLGVGHAGGFTSLIVPGAGEPNFDALEANPFQTRRQRQESEVKSLLEKVPSELITLDPDQISILDTRQPQEEEKATGGEKKREKRRARGKTVLTKEIHRTQQAKQDVGRELRRKQVREKERKDKEAKEKERSKESRNVLDRFR